jgi:hypothetical protein
MLLVSKKIQAKKVIQIREPLQRIVSMYNFIRCHSYQHPQVNINSKFREVVVKAKNLSPFSFSNDVDLNKNPFFIYFFDNVLYRIHARKNNLESLIKIKYDRVEKEVIDKFNVYDYIGTSEKTIQTLNYIRKNINLDEVANVESHMVTSKESASHDWMETNTLLNSIDLAKICDRFINLDMIIYKQIV